MADARPNPDELLRRVVEEEAKNKRGKLTIFFGAAPGVGKTYAMLEVARAAMQDEKRDVVVGVVETHGRYDTGALLLGLELLPRRRLSYRGVTLEELDLDAALARRPELIWWTSSRTRTPRDLVTRSVIRTSRSCSTPASTSSRR
jgi:two-component system sensor histidine kinase KdpD